MGNQKVSANSICLGGNINIYNHIVVMLGGIRHLSMVAASWRLLLLPGQQYMQQPSMTSVVLEREPGYGWWSWIITVAIAVSVNLQVGGHESIAIHAI